MDLGLIKDDLIETEDKTQTETAEAIYITIAMIQGIQWIQWIQLLFMKRAKMMKRRR